MICSKCTEEVTDGVSCSVCKYILHYECSGLSETTYRRMGTEKKNSWRCVSCRYTVLSATQVTDGDISLTTIYQEIKSLREEFKAFAEIRNQFPILLEDTRRITEHIKEIDGRMSAYNDRLQMVESKLLIVTDLGDELKRASNTIRELRQENSIRDQFSRLNNIEITGMPYAKGENLMSILHNMTVKVGINLAEDDVDYIQRVRTYAPANEKPGGVSGSLVHAGDAGTRSAAGRPPNIIVRFTRRRRKDELLAAVRARRGLTTADLGFNGSSRNVFFNDHLTPQNKLILKRARELKIKCDYNFLWVRDCRIFVRKDERSKSIRISGDDDLKKIH